MKNSWVSKISFVIVFLYLLHPSIKAQCDIDGTITLVNVNVSNIYLDFEDFSYKHFFQILAKYDKRWSATEYSFIGSDFVEENTPFDDQLHSFSNSNYRVQVLDIVSFVPSPYPMTYRWSIKAFTEDGFKSFEAFYQNPISYSPNRMGFTLGIPSYYPDWERILQNTADCFCNDQGFDGYVDYHISSTSGTVTWKPLNNNWQITGSPSVRAFSYLECGESILQGEQSNKSLIRSSLSENDKPILNQISLNQNNPNPFNPITKITYTIPFACDLKLIIYDVLGREVEKLVDGFKQVGEYSVDFDASNLSSGTYFYQLQTVGSTITKKMTVLK